MFEQNFASFDQPHTTPLFFPQSLPTLLFLLLLLLGVSEGVVGYFVGLISGEFYLVLENKDLDGFLDHLLDSVILIVSITVVKTVRVYVQKCLVVSWRASASKGLNTVYFRNLRFYNVNILGEGGGYLDVTSSLS